MLTRLALVSSLVATSCIALAQGSGLASAPAATIQKYKRLQFQYRQTSRDNTLDGRYRKNFQTVYGLLPDVEVSFDSNLDDDFRIGGKYAFFKGDNGFMASVGVFDILDDPQLYAAAKFDLSDAEIHFGLVDTEDRTAFVGFRRMVTEQLRFTADHLAGPSGRTSFRADYNFDANWRATVRAYFPNEKSSPRTHRFEITYRTDLP
jgi:hypothetical protein